MPIWNKQLAPYDVVFFHNVYVGFTFHDHTGLYPPTRVRSRTKLLSTHLSWQAIRVLSLRSLMLSWNRVHALCVFVCVYFVCSVNLLYFHPLKGLEYFFNNHSITVSINTAVVSRYQQSRKPTNRTSKKKLVSGQHLFTSIWSRLVKIIIIIVPTKKNHDRDVNETVKAPK